MNGPNKNLSFAGRPVSGAAPLPVRLGGLMRSEVGAATEAGQELGEETNGPGPNTPATAVRLLNGGDMVLVSLGGGPEIPLAANATLEVFVNRVGHVALKRPVPGSSSNVPYIWW